MRDENAALRFEPNQPRRPIRCRRIERMRAVAPKITRSPIDRPAMLEEAESRSDRYSPTRSGRPSRLVASPGGRIRNSSSYFEDFVPSGTAVTIESTTIDRPLYRLSNRESQVIGSVLPASSSSSPRSCGDQVDENRGLVGGLTDLVGAFDGPAQPVDGRLGRGEKLVGLVEVARFERRDALGPPFLDDRRVSLPDAAAGTARRRSR